MIPTSARQLAIFNNLNGAPYQVGTPGLTTAGPAQVENITAYPFANANDQATAIGGLSGWFLTQVYRGAQQIEAELSVQKEVATQLLTPLEFLLRVSSQLLDV